MRSYRVAANGRSETLARKLTEGLLYLAMQPLAKLEVI
jgi:hypothetical protein